MEESPLASLETRATTQGAQLEAARTDILAALDAALEALSKVSQECERVATLRAVFDSRCRDHADLLATIDERRREGRAVVTASGSDAGVAASPSRSAAGSDASSTVVRKAHLAELRASILTKETEVAAAIDELDAEDLKPSLDPTFAAAVVDAGVDTPLSSEVLRSLHTTWAGWIGAPPNPVVAMPGVGRTVEGEVELHPYVGDDRPKVAVEQPSEARWHQGGLLAHTRHAVLTRYADRLDKLLDESTEKATREAEWLSREITKRFEPAALLLEAWPRGDGPGELLHEPVGLGTTEVEDRGVTPEWWLAVANRAPFVITRVIVEAFVKPVTREWACALWFFIPERFRTKPDVFMSHAWDGSAWDIRPPMGVSGMWLDVLAVSQHPVVHRSKSGSDCAELHMDVTRSVPRVQRLHQQIAVVSSPSQSWCPSSGPHGTPSALAIYAVLAGLSASGMILCARAAPIFPPRGARWSLGQPPSSTCCDALQAVTER